jgi:hypothetical protein
MYLTNQTIIQNGQINGWTPTENSMSGAIEFSHPERELVLFATPNWDEDGKVPFAIADEDGEYDEISFPLELEGSIENQLQQYIEIITNITEKLR